jgi:uncharacterized phage protein (TIGR02218 family)
MRSLPPTIALALASGVTTHCQCWLLTRRDGVALGFTDHDRALRIGMQVFEAASGIEASAVESETGLAAANGEITGALSSARVTAEDIEAGRYDGAQLRRWLVDWSAPALDCLIDAVTIGEIRRKDGAFIAETRNALHALDLEKGRLYSSACSAELGDADCGVDLNDPAWRIAANVVTTDGRHRISAPPFATPTAGLFARGRLMVLTGANAGLSRPIRVHERETITLWEGLPADLLPGDSVVAIAGCDKRFATCRDRFANALNFRGFPLIPSPEFAFVYAQPGEGRHLGRPLVQL